ncbi:hypothetical protein DYI24_01270 [Rhodopseudomonas sp. BR0C11]|uniref:hypothetical protein n=1 Tax=Rhodopseudomonas sp. BR0C11 TaxID=2269370 RepID=UPI0013E024C6|nr:hypothetical protein [Rhodopseudomonas sp. BR0C11]NEV75676.1 hypothetical protein [Rhodopseudomonas sp. BR0C11]
MKHTGFRKYDARWLFDQEIKPDAVQALGMERDTLIGEFDKVVVACDSAPRGARPKLMEAIDYEVVSGLAAGSKVGIAANARHVLSRQRRAASVVRHYIARSDDAYKQELLAVEMPRLQLAFGQTTNPINH